MQDAARGRAHRQRNARVGLRDEPPMVDVTMRNDDRTKVRIGAVFQTGHRRKQRRIGSFGVQGLA